MTEVLLASAVAFLHIVVAVGAILLTAFVISLYLAKACLK